jgi:hypothetical protein
VIVALADRDVSGRFCFSAGQDGTGCPLRASLEPPGKTPVSSRWQATACRETFAVLPHSLFERHDENHVIDAVHISLTIALRTVKVNRLIRTEITGGKGKLGLR